MQPVAAAFATGLSGLIALVRGRRLACSCFDSDQPPLDTHVQPQSSGRFLLPFSRSRFEKLTNVSQSSAFDLM